MISGAGVSATASSSGGAGALVADEVHLVAHPEHPLQSAGSALLDSHQVVDLLAAAKQREAAGLPVVTG